MVKRPTAPAALLAPAIPLTARPSRSRLLRLLVPLGAVPLCALSLSSCTQGTPAPPTGPSAAPTPLLSAAPYEPARRRERIAPLPVSAARLARLPAATTYATLRQAPRDPDPFRPADGLVVHPRREQVIYARPGGPPVGVLPPTQLAGPTWVPVVERLPGWDRVLLPSRPNRSTGWLYTGDGGLRVVRSTYRVEVGLAARRLTVFDGDREVGSWPVAVGAPGTPTPRGRTFLLASLAPTPATYSPLFLALGAHSGTLRTFEGGPGTIALHGWPDRTAFGRAVSHGCVRVPAAALRLLSTVPLGSPVLITD
ncbi:L,D-transpeptidase [Streptosporangium longisporum]|uniref:L,D-TPase catalytic domain-containing protein n=1 Tax=Streptosporangium longisporum TaxID=46187 RepID=A0ABN3XWW2_9ACTN